MSNSNSYPVVEHQRLRVPNVRDVIVTEIVNDGGTFSRAIRILGLPLDGDKPIEVMEIVLETDSAQGDIELTTPPLEY